MAPGHVVVEADLHHRQTEERRTADVQLPRDGQMRLVKAVGPLPVPVRIAEQQRAGVARARRAKAVHVAADADAATHLERWGSDAGGVGHLHALPGLRGRGLRRHGIGDGRNEVAVARREVGDIHAPQQVLLGDGAHPGFAATGSVRLAAGLVVAHIAVVARHEARRQLAQAVALLGDHGIEHVLRDEVAVEEVGVDVARARDGAAVDRERIGTEVLGALPPVGQERVGHGAQVVLRLCIAVAVAQAAPVAGLDVRHAHGGAADLGAVASGGVIVAAAAARG